MVDRYSGAPASALRAETHAPERFALPERLGSFGFVEGSDSIIAAFEFGFALYEPETGKLEWLSRPRHDGPAVRFNDGRVDRQGRFWAGSMVEGAASRKASSIALTVPARPKIHATEVGISNSLCFSPDGRHLYFADTPLRTIFRFDLDATTGAISNRRIFAQTPEGAYPDGANVDCQGYVWSAHWGAGRVVRYAPDGTISTMVEAPAMQPTCVAFGGENLDLLFVTSAREGLDDDALRAQPHAGDVFVFKAGVSGLPDRAAQIGRSGA